MAGPKKPKIYWHKFNDLFDSLFMFLYRNSLNTPTIVHCYLLETCIHGRMIRIKLWRQPVPYLFAKLLLLAWCVIL